MTAVAERPMSAAPGPDEVLAPSPVRRRPVSQQPFFFVAALTLAVLCVWALVFELVLSGFTEARDQRALYAQLRQGLAAATTPIGGAITPGTPVMTLTGPNLRNVVVVEGTASSQLQQGPGHLRNTPLPGQAGTSVLFGRSASFGAPFRHIGALHPGDTLSMTTGQGAFAYRVVDVRRPGQRYTPVTAQSALVLISSEGTGIRSRWAPDRLVYVDAVLSKGQVQAAPPGRAATVPKSELAMRVDTSHVTTLVLWLQALLLVAIGLAWALARWGRTQALLVGIPLLLAVLWGTTQAAASLVPNLV